MAVTALALITGSLAACPDDGNSANTGPTASATSKSAGTTSSETAPATTTPAADPAAEVDAALEYVQGLTPHYDLEVPGGVVLVAQGNAVGSFAFGEAELHPRRPMRTTDRFPLPATARP